MSTAKRTITVKDAASFTLHEADLTGMEVREKLETPKRDIPCSEGLQWWIRWFPAGETEAHKSHVSVFLWVNKPVSAKYTFDVHGSSISKTGTHDYCNSPNGYGWPKLATHAELRPFFTNGKLTVTCNVEFDFPAQSFPGVCAFQLFEHVPTDVEFVFGSERVPAHKSFLALISPVFQKMFSRNKANSKSGRVEVTEFDFDTVKAATDYCYGRQLKEISVEIVVNILRFADKYRITAVINDLLKLPFLNLTICNFCLIVSYAYDCYKYSLLAKCYDFFKDHQDDIKAIKQFADLSPALVVHVLKSAFGLKTDFDVLRYANKNGIEVVMIHLETLLLDTLTLGNFFDTVSYAYDYAFGYFEFASHEQLRPLFRDGKLTIECSVEFDIQAPGFPIPRIFQLFEHVPTDVEFVIGSEIVPAHKSFLALISPVFQAMFTHQTAESKSSKIVITEFDFTTVSAAIDFCYGRQLRELSVEIVVNILRFADKYLMTAVIIELEKLPLLNPSVPTFCTIVHYAYDCNRDLLLTICSTFFKEHQDEIIATQKLAELPLALVVDTLKVAFGLKTDFDVLRHAHKTGIEFVMNDLEKPLLNSLTLDNFCDAVSYAWDCSRDELKKACAKYLNDNRDNVWSLKALNDLPVDVVGKLMNARYILDHGDD